MRGEGGSAAHPLHPAPCALRPAPRAPRAELLPLLVSAQVHCAHRLLREGRVVARLAGLRLQRVDDALQVRSLPARVGVELREAVLQRRELRPLLPGLLLLLHGIGAHLRHRLR